MKPPASNAHNSHRTERTQHNMYTNPLRTKQGRELRAASRLGLITLLLGSAALSSASAQEFGGRWLEEHPQSGPPMRLRLIPNDNQVAVHLSYTDTFSDDIFGTAIIRGNLASWSAPQSCAPQFQSPGYNYNNPGANFFSMTIRNDDGRRMLIYTQITRWNAPCGGNPIGTQRIQKTLFEYGHIRRDR